MRRNQSGPRDKVSLRHFVEHLASLFQASAFSIHVEESVVHNNLTSEQRLGNMGVHGLSLINSLGDCTFLEQHVVETSQSGSTISFEEIKDTNAISTPVEIIIGWEP
ncbi:hypothetical protein HID58_029744 [Brassica napus]|uniref:Uncharacterized protein n=1 Tax=Brassica napus TaxID=3708 RepID=A0ABQ8CE10_BRANA|nr:hypothetical protein HID58_029744 [Brassica napus]